MKYPVLRFLLNTVGRLSAAVRLGWRTGFDSGVMLEYIYENRPHGITPLGVWIDRQFMAHPVWDGVRSRRAFLVQHLKQAISLYEHPTVFDMAAGVGSYLFLMPENAASIVAGDVEPEAVEAGWQKLSRLNRQDIRFAACDAFDTATYPVQHATILVSSGFFDILTRDEDIQRVLANGSAITLSGARWVFTIQEHHPDLRLLKETMIDLHKKPWELVPRTAERLAEMAAPLGWRLERVDRNAYFAVGTLVRT